MPTPNSPADPRTVTASVESVLELAHRFGKVVYGEAHLSDANKQRIVAENLRREVERLAYGGAGGAADEPSKLAGKVVVSTDPMFGTQCIQWDKDAPPIEVGDLVYIAKVTQ